MGKRVDVEIAYKTWLVEECVAGRMRSREAARQAGVGSTTMQAWISQYRTEGREAFAEDGKPQKRKYSEDIKQAAIADYLSGKGSSMHIAEKYKLRSGNLVLDWVKEYNRHNKSASKLEENVMAGKSKHTLEQCTQVVKEYLDAGKSISELAEAHNLSYRLVYDWVKGIRKKALPTWKIDAANGRLSRRRAQQKKNCGCETRS